MASRWLIRIRARRALRALDRAGTALTFLWSDLKHSDFRARELFELEKQPEGTVAKVER